MVDVSEKPDTGRTARAAGIVRCTAQTLQQIQDGTTPKGAVLTTAEIAGIMGAKQTSALIPLCHPLPLSRAKLLIQIRPDLCGLYVEATVSVTGPTGVEMEALTAVSVACLTLYDMLKAIDKTMRITDIQLLEKIGGRSGHLHFEHYIS